MPDLTPFVSALDIGSKVRSATDDLQSGASAGGYAAWIYAVTGQSPAVVDLGGGRVRLVLSPEQQLAMRRWLDERVGSLFQKPKELPKVEYELGPVLNPWAMKYVIPVAGITFLAGWILHYYLSR